MKLTTRSARALIAGGLMAAATTLLPATAQASEKIKYDYDARGRLTKVERTGGRNDGLKSTYTFDPADNRTATSVSGAHSGVIVVPLNGFTLIPIS